MLVFRDGRCRVSPRRLACGLHDVCAVLPASPSRNDFLEPLLRAGELECALADSCGEEDPVLQLARQITDAFASGLGGAAAPMPHSQISELIETPLPSSAIVSAPEGFAYYALHPLAYANAIEELTSRPTAVIGIRSIGTTLSAAIAAALHARGLHAERITVRPTGHSFNRTLPLAAKITEFINRNRISNAQFIIADEGPGLSGSSFLSVAEALEEQGIAREDIIFVCGRDVDPHHLCTSNAIVRWQRYRKLIANYDSRPADAAEWLGAGEWRKRWLPNKEHWPAVWPQTERAKFLSEDEHTLWKFEGLGHYGNAPGDRARGLAEIGLGARVLDQDSGYLQSQIVEGRTPRGSDLSPYLLRQLANYCAVRARMFPADSSRVSSDASLAEMARINALEEFGIELDLSSQLETESLVITDARMMPYEWRFTPTGKLIKLDAAGHGDDHFYPGPCDIAWDIAGAIVEWEMPEPAADLFCAEFAKNSGENVNTRLPAYLLAYSLFRLGFSKMAADALPGIEDELRFRGEHARYRSSAQRYISQFRSADVRDLALQISG